MGVWCLWLGGGWTPGGCVWVRGICVGGHSNSPLGIHVLPYHHFTEMGPSLFADTTKRNFQTTMTSIQGDLLVNDLVQSHLKSADQWGEILKALSYVVTKKNSKNLFIFSSRLVLFNKILNSAESLYRNWVTPKSFNDIQIISAWTRISHSGKFT